MAGVRRILDNVVIPEIQSSYARAQVGNIIDTLASTEPRWDKVTPMLMEENDDLRFLLGSAVTALGVAQARRGNPVLQRLEQQIRQEIEKVPGAENKYPSFAALNDDNQRYQSLLVQIIDSLEAAKDTHGDDTGLRDLRQRIRDHIRKYVDKDMALGVMVSRRRDAELAGHAEE
jgi:hypothetical protein